MNEADIIAKLPGDLKRLAEIVGVEKALAVVDECGGSYLVIPKCQGLLKEIRDNEIRRLYDDKKNPVTIRQLAWRFKLSDRQINTILSDTDKEVPLPLIEMMGPKKHSK